MANGIYKVVAKHSGKTLDVNGVSVVDGAIVHQWTYVGGNDQKWQVEGLGGGLYRLAAVHSGKALEVAGTSLADVAQVKQSTWTGGGNQKWKIEDTSGGYYRLVAEHSNKALEVGGGPTSLQDGASVVQYQYGGGDNQR